MRVCYFFIFLIFFSFFYFIFLEIVNLNIPTAMPLVYEFDSNLKAVKHYYLASDEEIKAKVEAVANQGKKK